MKKTLLTLLLLSLTALPALAQPLSKEEYLGRWQRLTERVGVAGVGVETLIGQWAEAWPDDVQMLLAPKDLAVNGNDLKALGFLLRGHRL